MNAMLQMVKYVKALLQSQNTAAETGSKTSFVSASRSRLLDELEKLRIPILHQSLMS